MEEIVQRKTLSQHRVLLISANPHGMQKDLLNYEAEQIKAAIVGVSGLSDLVLTPVTVGSDEELENLIREVQPTIVQVSGAASPNGAPMLRSGGGRVRSLSAKILASLIQRSDVHPEYIFMSGHTVSKQLRALQDVAKSVISIRCKQYSFDYSVLASKLFYTHLGEGLNFRGLFDEIKESIRNLGVSSAYVARYVSAAGVDESRLKRASSGALIEDVSAVEQRGPFADYASFEVAATSRSIPYSDSISLRLLPKAALKLDEQTYRVWYGTNRKPIFDGGGVVIDYGSERGGQTSYGVCDVHIPKHHKIGSVGSPWWLRLPKFWEEHQLMLNRVDVLEEFAFWKSISEFFQSQSSNERSLLIFVHGYKTTFQDAAIRTAQLSFDLGVKGAAAFFSWPSKGHLMGYAADAAAVEASEEVLGNFVLEMANRSGADKVHLIAHSMGNRGVIRAFTKAIANVASSLKVPFGQIFLAAPDIDVDVFKNLAHVYPKLADRTTLYVSQKDKALLSSGILHDYPRAGYAPPVTVVSGIDTIEVTSIDLSFLGHGYVAEAKSVLTDMHQLMESGTPPARRFGLAEMLLGGGLRYWRLKS